MAASSRLSGDVDEVARLLVLFRRDALAYGDVLAHFLHAFRPEAFDRRQIVHALEGAIRFAHLQILSAVQGRFQELAAAPMP
jgi:hypothetical protein